MTHSVRLRLIGWLERIRDHVPEQLVQKLRGAEMHPKPRCHDDLCRVVCVDKAGPEPDCDDAAPVSGLGYRIHEGNGNIGVTNFLPVGTYGQVVPALNHHLVCHQKSPLGTVYDLAKLNASVQGVES